MPRAEPARPRRYKAATACATCRRRKIKCDGARPVCGRCHDEAELHGQCTYANSLAARSSPLRSHPSSSALDEGPPTAELDRRSRTPSPQAYHHALPGTFVCKVKAAIDAKLGPSAVDVDTKRLPLLDAPMFGSLTFPAFDHPESRSRPSDHHVLPPREDADLLLAFYWRHLEMIEPVLEQERFYQLYHSLYTGNEPDFNYDQRIFLSTLNVVFALATQLQETLASEQRVRASTIFFQRAWAVLRPEITVWYSASVELVQCLLLMCRYLQCTDNHHQTWLVLGSMVRIAQTLGFHLPRTDTPPLADLQRCELWHHIVHMDRSLSWSLGRPLALPLTTVLPPAVAKERSTSFFVKISINLIKLDQLTSQILLAQASANSNLSEAMGASSTLAHPDIPAAMSVDAQLSRLSDSFETNVAQRQPSERPLHSRAQLFRIRVAHARILLFRPMLAKFCFAEHTKAPTDVKLEDRLLQTCAIVCVESTARLLSLVRENIAERLPWWYRVFYLFVALQHLLAAMIRPGVFVPWADELWDTAMRALAAHGHLSPVVGRFTSSFGTMYQKITEALRPPVSVPMSDMDPRPFDIADDIDFDEILRQIGFDMDGRAVDAPEGRTDFGWGPDWGLGPGTGS